LRHGPLAELSSFALRASERLYAIKMSRYTKKPALKPVKYEKLKIPYLSTRKAPICFRKFLLLLIKYSELQRLRGII